MLSKKYQIISSKKFTTSLFISAKTPNWISHSSRFHCCARWECCEFFFSLPSGLGCYLACVTQQQQRTGSRTRHEKFFHFLFLLCVVLTLDTSSSPVVTSHCYCWLVFSLILLDLIIFLLFSPTWGTRVCGCMICCGLNAFCLLSHREEK